MELRGFIIAVVWGAISCAQDRPEPTSPETQPSVTRTKNWAWPEAQDSAADHAADQVLVAFEENDARSFRALAASENPDPWIVADELCARGKHDAALAFAIATPGRTTERLPAYVASLLTVPVSSTARDALSELKRARAGIFAGGGLDRAAVLDATKLAHSMADSVVAVRLLVGRGRVQPVGSLERIQALRAAAERAERLGWHRKAKDTYDLVGYHCTFRADWRGALDARKRQLTAAEALEDRPEVCRALTLVGGTYVSLGQYGIALEHMERALKLAEETPDRARAAHALQYIGSLYASLGDYRNALTRLKRALEHMSGLKDRAVAVASILQSTGSIYTSLGEHQLALEYMERALKIRKSHLDRLGEVRTYWGIGGVYGRIGSYDKALEYAERALHVAQDTGHRAGAAHALGRIGFVYTQRGDNVRAEHYYRRALQSSRAIGLSTRGLTKQLALLLLNGLDRPVDAAALFEEAITGIETQRSSARSFSHEVRARYETKLRSGSPYDGMARALLGSKRPPSKALEYLERGRARGVLELLASSQVEPFAEAERRAQERDEEETLTEIRAVRAQLADAEATMRRLRHTLATIGDQPPPGRVASLEAELSAARARHRTVMGMRARLIRDFVPSAAPATVAALQQLLGPKDRLVFYSVSARGTLIFVVPPTGQAVRVHDGAMGRDELAKAVEHHLAWIRVEGRQARGMDLDEEQPVAAPPGRSLFEALVPKALRAELAGMKRVYLVPHDVLHRLPFETLRTGEDSYWLDTLPPVVYGHSGAMLLWSKKRRAEKAATKRKYEVVALGDPIYSRNKDEAAPPTAGVVVMATAQPLQAGDVIVAYADRPVSDHAALDKATQATQQAATVKLKVWRASTTVELDVPGGPLPAKTSKDPVAKAWAELRMQSQLVLKRGAVTSRVGAPAPLPGTRREVTAIRKALEKPVVTLLGEEATKARLFELAPHARFLHLATHGIADEREGGGYSRMLLTLPRVATPEDDGSLHLYELFANWRGRLANCELVVLSACDTLKGPLQRDEGSFAMPLGFLYAGASAVIGSHWPVDDASTAELFADVYRRLAKGTPKLQAFTEARKALRKKYPQPYFWAPFVYVGDPR